MSSCLVSMQVGAMLRLREKSFPMNATLMHRACQPGVAVCHAAQFSECRNFPDYHLCTLGVGDATLCFTALA